MAALEYVNHEVNDKHSYKVQAHASLSAYYICAGALERWLIMHLA